MSAQLGFDLDSVPSVRSRGRMEGHYQPYRQKADLLMESSGQWAFDEVAERCFMRLADKTILIENKKEGMVVPFNTDENKSLVGWGPGLFGRLEVDDANVGRAFVGTFGIRDVHHRTGKASAYAYTVTEYQPLAVPDIAMQSLVLAKVARAGGDMKALYHLRGHYVILDWKIADPILKGVQTQYLLVESVSLKDGSVRLSGANWQVRFENVTGLQVGDGELLLEQDGKQLIRLDLTTALGKKLAS